MEENITYKIILSDGTEIDNLSLNGDNFISATELTDSDFAGKLSNVTIVYGEMEEFHESMELIQCRKYGSEWWFIIRDIPESKLTEMKNRADIEYIAMMSDIEL